MKKWAILLYIILFFVFELSAQIPTNRLQGWYVGDSVLQTSGFVSQWSDISGNGNHLLQVTGTRQPEQILDVLNGHAVLDFDGINDYLQVTYGSNLSQPISIFVVWRINVLLAQYIFDGLTVANSCSFFYPYNGSPTLKMYAGAAGGYSISYNKPVSADYTISSLFYNTISSLYDNGVFIGSYDIGANQLDGLNVGTRYLIDARYLNGNIAEFIIYDTTLTAVEQQQVELYLMNKYAPPVSLGPDTTIEHGFCPMILYAGSGYSSYLWSDGSTADSLVVSESGSYWVQTIDMFDRITSDTINIIYPSLSLPDTAFCLTDTVTINTGLNHAYTFLWSDASSDSLLDVFAPGEYWVEVTDSTLGACSVRDTFVVAVDSFPVLASLGPDTAMCTGELFALQSQTGPGYTYNWSTGSSDSAIVISGPGTYSLTVTNYNVCTAIDTVDITIKGVRPTPIFSYGTVCYGDSTNFVDMSYTQLPDGISNILFDFNDGDSSVQSNPFHSFAAPGDFPVTLQVYSDSGCYADTTISVHVRSLPTADFLPLTGCENQLIQFSDSSEAAEGNIVLWDWDFGDDSTSNVQHPLHLFDSVDVYYTTLIVSDVYGCSDTVSLPVNVRITPDVDFEYDESCLGTSTYFTELTDVPPYSPIIYRRWEFGDGNYSLLQNPQHQYDNPGTYVVKLLNTNISGCTDSIEKVIAVHPFPVAGFISDTACETYTVCFTDTSSVLYSTITERLWNFGQGNMSADSIGCTIYPDTGYYTVSLTVTSAFGCSSVANKQIYVHPIPVADFSIAPEYGVPPLDVQFYNYSTGANTWIWDFGDGNYSTVEHPQHTYIVENIFNVTLVAENEFTCTDTAYGNVYLIPSSLDLVLSNLEVTDSSGYYYLYVEFFNNGTRNIREIAFDARIGSNVPVRETWSGLLLPGQENTYTFTSAFLNPDNENIRTICVEGTVLDAYGQEDETPEDNTVCFALSSEFFIASVYPSPADDYVYINIALPDDGDLELIVSSEDGKIVREGLFTDQDEGTLRTRINVQNLAGGVYVIRARYMDKEDVVKFVKE